MLVKKDGDYYINKIDLLPHPEGGFYKETYRSDYRVNNQSGEERNALTAIFFLLKDDQKSHFHRIKSDELWFHHEGEALEIIYIQNGAINTIYLGKDLGKGELMQATIPANVWFASKLKKEKDFALVSCTVSPGFDFEDFEMAKRADLIKEFPNLQQQIEPLCLP